MWIQPSRCNVDLVPGAIHVVHEYTGNLCKDLSRCLLRDVCVKICNIKHFILFPRPDPGPCYIRKSFNIDLLLTFYDNFIQSPGLNRILLILTPCSTG